MGDRTDYFPWSGVTFGLASVVMFGFASHEGRKAKQLQLAHQLRSVSEATTLANYLPLLISVRGKANSDHPLKGSLSHRDSVMIEQIEELSLLKHNERGGWSPESKLQKHLQHQTELFITDDGTSRLGVQNPFEASNIESVMSTTKHFREGKSSSYKRIMDRLSGCQPLGVWETERILPVGTAVTVVGELAKAQDGKQGMLVRKPSGPCAGQPFYITSKSFEELQASLMRNTGTCKWLGIGFGTVSLMLIGIQVWKHVRSTMRYRRIRKQLAEEEKRRRVERENLSTSATELHPDEEDEDKGKCIVCWDRPADAVFIPCGHLCACLRCCLELNRCPVCRRPCSVHRIYMA